MRNARVAAAALIAILLIATVSFMYLPHQRQSTGGVGTKFSQEFCLNAVNNATAMKEAMDYGITCFRTDISLKAGEIKNISGQATAGAQYLGILDYNTVGAQPSGNGCVSGCNWTLEEWNESVANAVADYPEIDSWEIWNEPMVGIFMSGYENGSALDYFNMIRSAYLIIKSREPNATVVCFGGAQMFPISEFDDEYYFYRQVWRYGASQYCDAISLHTYSQPYYGLNQTVGQTETQNVTLGEVYNATLSVYENLTHKPIWITETGIPSNNWTEGLSLSDQRQASFLKQDFSFFAQYSYVKRIYWFHLVGAAAGGADYGILNYTTLQPKPSFYAFLYFSRNSIS